MRDNLRHENRTETVSSRPHRRTYFRSQTATLEDGSDDGSESGGPDEPGDLKLVQTALASGPLFDQILTHFARVEFGNLNAVGFRWLNSHLFGVRRRGRLGPRGLSG